MIPAGFQRVWINIPAERLILDIELKYRPGDRQDRAETGPVTASTRPNVSSIRSKNHYRSDSYGDDVSKVLSIWRSQ